MNISLCTKIKMQLAALKMTQKDLHTKLVDRGYKVSYNQLRQYLNELIISEKAENIIWACVRILKEAETDSVRITIPNVNFEAEEETI